MNFVGSTRQSSSVSTQRFAAFPFAVRGGVSSGRSGVEISPSRGPPPRYETGHELAVAYVLDTEALPELAFFQRELEGELGHVEDGKQHKAPAAGEQSCARDQAEIGVVQRIADVPVRSLHHQALRYTVLFGPCPYQKLGSGEQQPGPSHLRDRPCPCRQRTCEH